jgi:CubicO group peptidase (beta-lactamase class C family)
VSVSFDDGPAIDKRNNATIDVVHRMKYLRPMAELSQTSQYCNFHYTVLSHILEVLSGIPHHEFIQKRIFEPLNLTATFNHTAAAESGRRVPAHFREGVNALTCKEIWRERNVMDVRGHWRARGGIMVHGGGWQLDSWSDGWFDINK